MSTEHPEHEHETAHVDHATIDVSQATIIQSPASRQAAQRLAWSLVVLFVVLLALDCVIILVNNSQVHQVRAQSERIEQNARSLARANAILRRQITADCGFDRDLAGLPLTNLPNGHPSKLGVRIISDSRGAWAGHGCPGHLPPPDPTYVRGAKFYNLPVN